MNIRGRWYPAAVVLPDHHRPWQRCYVIAADDGLHIFRRQAEEADWHARVDWSKVTMPTTRRPVERGLDIPTERGLVVVTAGQPCRCGGMGRWSGPSWAGHEAVRG